MSTHAAAVRSIGLLLLLWTAAACGTSGSPAATTPAVATGTPAISPAPSMPAESAPVASPAPPDAAPPAAVLSGPSGATAPGAQGTFTWDGLVSDSPWIVGASVGAVRATDGLAVTLIPGVASVSWQARWAPVTGGVAGTPVDGGSGTTARSRCRRR